MWGPCWDPESAKKTIQKCIPKEMPNMYVKSVPKVSQGPKSGVKLEDLS